MLADMLLIQVIETFALAKRVMLNVYKVVYDSSKISFDELLEVFWQVHDPTTLNRQGADEGTQYRSVIFYHDDEQKQKARKYKTELDKSGAYNNPIVTTLEPFH
jgi:peptide-methionine (S)-S-oxide reductase